MSGDFLPLRLGEVMRLVRDAHAVDPSRSYPNVGLLSFGRGVFQKPPIEGASSSATTLYRIRNGQFIYSRLFAFEGAYGVVPEEFDGCFVSNEFPTFDIDPARVEPRYIYWLFKLPRTWEVIAKQSTGIGHRRQRVHPEQLLEISVALPERPEQRRIVALIETAAAKLAEAQELRRQASSNIDALLRSLLFSDRSAQALPMQELVQQRIPDVQVDATETYHFAGVYSFGRGVFRGDVRQGMEFSYERLSRLRAGDFVYPKLMAWEGALGVVPPECDGLVVSPEFPVFEIDRAKVIPEVLDIYFRTPSVWPNLSGASTGTNVRRRRLSPSDFLKHKMPVPNAAVQARIREIKQRADQVKELQSQTAGSLESMLPRILDGAFSGRL